MVFSVYEQGIRIKTPWNKIFPPRTVEETSEISATHRITESEIIKPSPLASSIKSYQQIEEGEPERKRIFRAAQLMNRKIIVLHQDDKIIHAWQIFQQYGFRHIPIVDEDEQLLGILSDRDILRKSSSLELNPIADIGKKRVATVMSERVLTASEDTEIRLLAEAMTGYHVGAIPILDEERHIIGMVTRSDILNAIMKHAPVELWS